MKGMTQAGVSYSIPVGAGPDLSAPAEAGSHDPVTFHGQIVTPPLSGCGRAGGGPELQEGEAPSLACRGWLSAASWLSPASPGSTGGTRPFSSKGGTPVAPPKEEKASPDEATGVQLPPGLTEPLSFSSPQPCRLASPAPCLAVYAGTGAPPWPPARLPPGPSSLSPASPGPPALPHGTACPSPISVALDSMAGAERDRWTNLFRFLGTKATKYY